MEPRNVTVVTVDGRTVFYASGEVIAVGETARDFVINVHGGSLHGTGGATSRRILDGDEPVSLRRPTYRVQGLADPLDVVSDARARGLRVQLNHVLLAHGCCGCPGDPCCTGGTGSVHQTRANPYWANPYWANPYWANPYWANPFWRTTAVPIRGVPELAGHGAEIGRAGPRVWILDTGRATLANSPSIGDRGIRGDDEEPDLLPSTVDGLVDPVAGHGTFIAGIVERLEPGCEITVKHVVDPDGSALESDIEAAIYDLLASGADQSRTLLNLSFGGALQDPCDSVLGDAIADAQDAGVVVVASAGNEASCRPTYPANFAGVVAVGAVDEGGQPAPFTNVGHWVQACAVGVEIASTFFDFQENPASPTVGQPTHNFQGWARWSGTSFAAPVVVAAIAQQLSDGAMSSSEALAAVLDAGSEIECLGVLIEPNRVDQLFP